MFSLVGLVFLFVFLLSFVNAAKEIPLSVLAETIQEEQVESITIRGNNIEAVLKDGTHLYSKKEAETSLSESLLNYGVSTDKIRNIMITEVKGGRFFTISALLLFLLPFGIYIVWFFVFYFLILAGFKILKIEGIPRSKITVYIFAIFFLSLFLNSGIPAVLKDVSNSFILYFANLLISFLVVFLLLKYYFLLSGKKLWQFLLYLVILSLIFSTTITLLQLL